MDVKLALFYVLAGLTVVSASSVILLRNPVRSALSLVLTFVSVAALWLLLEAEFLAISLILIYVGAVMVLFLFVVMMIDLEQSLTELPWQRYVPIGLGIFVLWMGLILFVLRQDPFFARLPDLKSVPLEYSHVRALGEHLYQQYAYPIQLAGVLLLAAMVAAISLAFRRVRRSKRQDPNQQVAVSKSQRLRIIPSKEVVS